MPIVSVCDHGVVGRIVRDLIAILQGKKSVKRYIIKFHLLVYEEGDGWMAYDLMTILLVEKSVVEKDILNSRNRVDK